MVRVTFKFCIELHSSLFHFHSLGQGKVRHVGWMFSDERQSWVLASAFRCRVYGGRLMMANVRVTVTGVREEVGDT